MSAISEELVPGLALTREQALALPGMRRYRLVEFLVRWEHFGAARELLESLVARKAGRFFYQYRLAQCCLATGEIERARALARDLHAAAHTHAVGMLAVGDVFYVEGRLARAEEQYREALAVEKTRESAQRRLAWCLLHRRNLSGAAELVEQLSAGKRPAQLTPAAVRLRAAVATAQGDAEQALALRRELKARWQQELSRLRATLDLAPIVEDLPFTEADGLKPAAAERLTTETRSGHGGSTEEVESIGEEPSATTGQRQALAGSHLGDEITPSLLQTAPAASDKTSVPTPNTQYPTPSTGYFYPTAKERRAMTEAAARREAARSRRAPGNDEPPSGPPPERSPEVCEPSAPATRRSGEVHGAQPALGDPNSEAANFKGGSIAAFPPVEAPAFSGVMPPERPSGPAPERPSRNGRVQPSSPARESSDPSALQASLKEYFGHEQFRPGQEEVVRHALAGRSVLAMMPTGQGKSLCFQLPALLLPRATVVISPLIALMQDQVEGLPDRIRHRAAVLNSSVESAELGQRLRALAAGRYSLIYAAPERLRQRPFLHALRRAGVSLLVVDEAHCISLWGQDFRPDYLFLPKVLTELGGPPLLAMTATATPENQADIRRQFGVPMETISQGVYRPNLRLEVQRQPDKSSKLKALKAQCLGESGATIIYVNARARTENLAQALNEAGVSAGFYHAGLPAALRESMQQRFMAGEIRCLVATVAFGMGIDKPDIRLIVHHDLPHSLEGYYQEAGRAGRDRLPARCVLFVSPGDRASLGHWMREQRPYVDELLRVHRALAAATRDLTVTLDDLERETGLEETPIRVAISLLERVGALRRQYDLPRLCTLQVLAQGDTLFQQFVSAAHLRPHQRVTRDTAELCLLTDIAPDEIEPGLLGWADAGWLEYRGSGRGLRLELQDLPDLPARLRELLRAMEAVEETRLNRLDDYAYTSGCRHAFLSDYFGHPHPAGTRPGCGACDNCLRVESVMA